MNLSGDGQVEDVGEDGRWPENKDLTFVVFVLKVSGDIEE